MTPAATAALATKRTTCDLKDILAHLFTFVKAITQPEFLLK
jgi:hypothetical protein